LVFAEVGKLTDQQILVLGLGVSGSAAAELARLQEGNVTVLDAGSGDVLDERAERLRDRDVCVRLDWNRPSWDEPVDLAILSPGIPPESVLGQLAGSLDCPVIAELEFGYRFCSCPVLAITGTNGKTTTVELTTHCLKGAGKRALAAGNIGLPLSDACRKSGSLDFIVVEVSSFQLEHVDTFAPISATCLNVSSDHQDRYDDFADYQATKLRLFARMSNPGQAVLRHDLWGDAQVQSQALFAAGHPVTFAADTDADDLNYFVDADGQICFRQDEVVEVLMHQDDLKLKGAHNVENVMAALALCRLAGVPHSETIEPAKRFAPSAHRLELLSVSNGVRYINDSKATNPDAMIQALRTCTTGGRYQGKVLLIAGGRDKRMDFGSVVPYLEQYVKEVYLLGENKDRLAELWSGHVNCLKFASMAALIDQAVEDADPGDTVLLSPGCASFDMFKSYQDRGNQFIQALRRRLGE
jgi:UDP-N-acetylmuramoylalanine--D-glutamate ligase